MQDRLEIVARALVACAVVSACSSTSTTESGTGGTSSGGSAGVAATGGTGGATGGSAGAGGTGGSAGTSAGGTAGTSAGGTAGAGATGGTAGTTADAGDAATDAAPGVKRIFVTSALYPGDLKTAGNAAFGPPGADNLCNQHAAKLGGKWVAWLSGSQSAFDRVPPTSNGPWYRVDGVTLVFADRNALKSTPVVPIATDEDGVSYTSNLHAWTGTDLGGTAAGTLQRCNGWTGGVGFFGQYGNINTVSANWTNAGVEACEVNKNRLICLEL